MNAKIIIIALCAVQLATAQNNQFSSYFQAVINNVQSVATSIQQQYTQRISEALNAGKSAIDSLLQQFQNQQANIPDKLNISDSAPKVRACIQDGQAKAIAVANDTNGQLETQAASQSEGAQVYVDQARNVSKKASDTAGQIFANYTACASKGIFSTVTCLPSAIAKATSLAAGLVTEVQTIFASAQKAITQIASNLVGIFQAYIQTATQEFKTIGEDLEKCIEDAAANSTSSAPASPNK